MGFSDQRSYGSRGGDYGRGYENPNRPSSSGSGGQGGNGGTISAASTSSVTSAGSRGQPERAKVAATAMGEAVEMTTAPGDMEEKAIIIARTDTAAETIADMAAVAIVEIVEVTVEAAVVVTLEECDAFGVRSQARWAEALATGWFDAELVPLDVKAGRKTQQFAVDESPRVVDIAKLAKLKPVFKKDGVMTADNAFSISDGAGAVQLVSEDAVKKHNLTPWRVW
ncbi:hypothetical protein PRIC2_010151 [Phytophthora ramorum]